MSLEELVREAGFVSLHVNLSAENPASDWRAGTWPHETDSYFINTSRSPVVDEGALLDALRNGQIAGAGLDVYENDPRLTRGLLRVDNVVLLAHWVCDAREAYENGRDSSGKPSRDV